jgi:RNA polymerase sigma factor (sigma-70 family)
LNNLALTPADTGYINDLIQHVADSVAAKTSHDDPRDIQQDLHTHLLGRWPDYDATRSSPRTFADRVVRNHAKTLLQKCYAQCRDPRRECGVVSEFESDPGGEPSIRNVQDYLRATARDDERCLDLRLDVRAALQTLPPEFREICELRSRGMPVTEIAKCVGISVPTAHRWFRRIREQFREVGLAEYVA